MLQEVGFSYKVKIYNPAKRSKFSVRHMHNVRKKFESVAALRCALWHEFEDVVPEQGEFNIGYFEGRQHTKKWLVSSQDLEVMYAYYAGKEFIFRWCDANEQEVGDESIPKKRVKRDTLSSKRTEKEEELEDTFQTLKTKHGSNFSSPQLRLWARMIVTGSHSDTDIPPNVPMINGIQKQTTHRESLTDVVSSAAAAIAKVLTPPSTPTPTLNSPNKTVDTRMKNLEQLKYLQQLREDGILTEEECLTQKKIVLQSLNRLV